MSSLDVYKLLMTLRSYGRECSWIEYKVDNSSEKTIGERVSALSNAAAIEGRTFAYLVYGVENDALNIVGTHFRPRATKVGNEDLKPWIEHNIEPRMSIESFEIDVDGAHVVILRIPAAQGRKTLYKGEAYCRVEGETIPLDRRPDLETKLFQALSTRGEEDYIAMQGKGEEELFSLLDFPSYYQLLGLPFPSSRAEMVRKFVEEGFLVQDDDSSYSITALGAITFARSFAPFKTLRRRYVRVVTYRGVSRLVGQDEMVFDEGYAIGFENIVTAIIHALRQEKIVGAMRVNIDPYSEITLREAVGNMLIHGDLYAQGSGPLVEIFENRIVLSNPGSFSFDADRILDVSPSSKNWSLALFMHRIGIGDERGSGFDKMVMECEKAHSPAPSILQSENSVTLTLYPPCSFDKRSNSQLQHDIYMHCCLRYLNGTPMTNSSLRELFGLGEKKASVISKLAKKVVEQGKIKTVEGASKKNTEYVPYWA